MIYFSGCIDNDEVVESSVGSNLRFQNDSVVTSVSDVTIGSDRDLAYRLEQINDSIVGCIDAGEVGINKEINLDFAFLVAVDAKGFAEGARYGWENGKGFGKFTNAALFGTIFSAAYSTAYMLVLIVRDIFHVEAGRRQIVSAASNVLAMDNLVSETNRFLIKNGLRFSKSDLEIISFAYAHNKILPICQSLDSQIVSYLGFSNDQIDILNSDEFKLRFAEVPNNIKNVTQLSGFENYERESLVFTSYLNGLSRVSGSNEREILSKIEGLCYEYTKTVKSDSVISDEHKDNMIMAFYVAPFSALYWFKNYYGSDI